MQAAASSPDAGGIVLRLARRRGFRSPSAPSRSGRDRSRDDSRTHHVPRITVSHKFGSLEAGASERYKDCAGARVGVIASGQAAFSSRSGSMGLNKSAGLGPTARSEMHSMRATIARLEYSLAESIDREAAAAERIQLLERRVVQLLSTPERSGSSKPPSLPSSPPSSPGRAPSKFLRPEPWYVAMLGSGHEVRTVRANRLAGACIEEKAIPDTGQRQDEESGSDSASAGGSLSLSARERLQMDRETALRAARSGTMPVTVTSGRSRLGSNQPGTKVHVTAAA